MLSAKDALYVALGLFSLIFLARFVPAWSAARRRGPSTHPADSAGAPSAAELAIGFVTNFFDSLGIGSFAPTTSLFKLLALVPDECIPGTLNVGHAIPTVVQAAAFLSIVEVDVTTLVAMIAAAVLGAWLGAGVVAQWPRRHVQVGMGLALIVAASLMLMTNLELFPAGGEALGLVGPKLLFAIGVNFLLGALMTLGIGLYAPCMILVSLLGMNPRAAFPIMMGSCAFLMTAGSLRFIEKRAFSLRASLGLLVGGVPGVLVGAFIVKSLPLTMIRWLVVVVVVYTATSMLRSAARERAAASGGTNALEPAS
ncbi:MAG: sulfite exporter TauE/SafE family protein [Vicinamibacterales bacterium]